MRIALCLLTAGVLWGQADNDEPLHLRIHRTPDGFWMCYQMSGSPCGGREIARLRAAMRADENAPAYGRLVVALDGRLVCTDMARQPCTEEVFRAIAKYGRPPALRGPDLLVQVHPAGCSGQGAPSNPPQPRRDDVMVMLSKDVLARHWRDGNGLVFVFARPGQGMRPRVFSRIAGPDNPSRVGFHVGPGEYVLTVRSRRPDGGMGNESSKPFRFELQPCP